MTSRKKQEENHLKILKDLLLQPANKKCLECDQRGPTYVDVTIGSFVCTSCGGILRGLNPPHRVKSISMTTFIASEISFIESRGNEWCRAVYLAKYDEQSRAKPESRSDHSKLKHFLELKYEQKRWYESPTQQRKLMESMAAAAKKNRETTSPPSVKPLHSLLGNNVNTVQIPSAKSDISKGIKERKTSKPSTDLLGNLTSPQLVSPVASKDNIAQSQGANAAISGSSGFADGFADFDKAFGGFSPTAAPTSQPAFPAFGLVGTEPMQFTNSNGVTNTTKNNVPPAKSNVDKYAALADLDMLFGKTEPQPSESLNDFSWSSPAKPAFSANQGSAMSQAQPQLFGLSPPQQQLPTNLFNTAPVANSISANPAASSTSWMAAPATSSWSSSSSNWNPSGSWQPTYQQPASANNAPVASNPFFTPTPATNPQPNMFGQVNSAGTEYGAWTQPAMPAQGGYGGGAGMMSSTNPFAMGGSAPTQQPSYFQQQTPSQSLQPTINNPSNPFMF